MTEDDEGGRQTDLYTAALAGELADCVRDCMRAMAAGSDERIYHAALHFRRVLDGLGRRPETNLHVVFSGAIEQLRPALPDMLDNRKAIE